MLLAVSTNVKGLTYGEHLQQTGLTLSELEITSTFNLPLRDHSAQMTLTYNRQTKNTVVKIYLLGVNLRGRWDIVSGFAQTLDITGRCRLHAPIQINNQQLEIAWDVKSPELFQKLLREFDLYAHWSMDVSSWNRKKWVKEWDFSINEDALKELIHLANTQNYERKTNAFEITKAYLENNQGFDEAFQLIQNSLFDTTRYLGMHYVYHYPACDLAKLLIQKNHKIPELLSLILQLGNHEEMFFKVSALELITEYVKQGQGIEEAKHLLEITKSVDFNFVQKAREILSPLLIV